MKGGMAGLGFGAQKVVMSAAVQPATRSWCWKRPAQTEHECIDMAEVTAALNVSNPIYGNKKHRVKYGKCRYDGCTITTSRGRAKYRCGACGDGKGWFYHLPCFMATHRITKK